MSDQKIHGAIADIMAEVGAIGKDGINKQQGFRFRSIEAMCNRLHGLMAKHRVFCAPEVVGEPTVTSGESAKSGAAWNQVVVTVKYTFFAEDGSSISATVLGQGLDYADKAAPKAMTFAFKTALAQVFCLATEDMPDPDADDPHGDDSGAAARREALKEKMQGRAGPKNPPQAPPDPKADARSLFVAACQELSVRDCGGWEVNEQDAADIYRQVQELSGNPKIGGQEAAQWLREQATLGVVEDGSGVVVGIEVKTKQETPA